MHRSVFFLNSHELDGAGLSYKRYLLPFLLELCGWPNVLQPYPVIWPVVWLPPILGRAPWGGPKKEKTNNNQPRQTVSIRIWRETFGLVSITHLEFFWEGKKLLELLKKSGSTARFAEVIGGLNNGEEDKRNFCLFAPCFACHPGKKMTSHNAAVLVIFCVCLA